MRPTGAGPGVGDSEGVGSTPVEAGSRPIWHHLVIWSAVLVLAATLVVAVSPWAAEPPGYSLDGFNAAVWGMGAESAAENPIGSRLGGARYDGYRYANHPPLTVWSAAIGHELGGGTPLAVRLPAILASLGALALIALLLLDAGLRPESVVIGLVVTGTTGMFLTYGAMLDTPVISLPFGLAAIAAAQRGWQGRPPPTPWLVLIGALAALSGWQAALGATVAAGTVLVLSTLSSRAQRRVAWRTSRWLGVGIALGAAITVAWIIWVHGDLGPLLDQAGHRMNRVERATPWPELVWEHQVDLFGPAVALLILLVAVGLAFGTRHRGDRPPDAWWQARGPRPLLAVLTATVVGYTLLFRSGAAVHDYWTYWGTALVGVGAATAAELLVRKTRSRNITVGRAVGVVLLAITVLSAVQGVQRQTDAERLIRQGLDIERFLDLVPPADSPDAVAVAVYGSSDEVPWATVSIEGTAVAVRDVDGLRALPPTLPVLVVLRGAPSPALQEMATAFDDRFALVPAGDLADHLDR